VGKRNCHKVLFNKLVYGIAPFHPAQAGITTGRWPPYTSSTGIALFGTLRFGRVSGGHRSPFNVLKVDLDKLMQLLDLAIMKK